MGSGRLSFAGRYLILTTGDTKFGVSKKCTSAEKKTFEALFAEKKDPAYGLIVRTNARNVSNQTLLEEYSKLHAQASKTLSEAVSRTCYTCLSEREEPALTYLKNTDLSSVKEIVSDDPVICENVRAYLKNLSEAVRPPVRLYEDSAFPLSKLYNLGRELERARLPKVWLKSGGYLMIERTEAMTVIDVNSAKSSHYKDAQAHYRSINEEAAQEIARQLRLRNIGGIIIVDFINLSSEEEKKQLLAALRKYCAPDPMPVNVCGITSLGLVELTRKKSQKSLEEQLTQA